MPKSFEEISKSIASQNGKTDANLANDSNHLGGIPAEDYATKEWVRNYHDDKESSLKQYVDQQDTATLNAAKEYTNSAIRNQDFSDFAEIDDLQALNTNLTNKINTDIAGQKSYTDQKTQAIVDDVNANFEDVEDAIDQLNDNVNELFQSVSDGKEQIAEAITDKGIATSATATFETMASNIEKIQDGLIVIPDGYVNTSDATAGANQILQGYTAYANGNKIYGTYVGSGSPGGGVILGDDDVVATKVYGEAGVLTGSKLTNTNNINLTEENTISSTIPKGAIISAGTYGTFAILSRKITENIQNEIAIYNITINTFGHTDPNSKFSYSYEELGIEGTLLCIAASPLCAYNNFVQISIGTTTGIYVFWFNPQGNNGNGSIGEASIYSDKTKFVINNPCGCVNGITYSNTDQNTFAYYSNSKIYIVNVGWSTDQVIDLTEVSVSTYGGTVNGLFSFNASDRFLMFAPWGSISVAEVNIMLLDDFRYIIHEQITQSGNDGWKNGQLAISPTDDFAIINGKPYTLGYDLKEKTISYTKMSDTNIIPWNISNNESLYACFSSDGKYVYALSSFDKSNNMFPLATFKVDYTNLNSQWQIVSNSLAVGINGIRPIIDIVNKKVLNYIPYHDDISAPMNISTIGFYYYYSDPNVKTVIGLSWNNELYKKSW